MTFFFLLFWRPSEFGQKNQLIFGAKFNASSHFSGKSLVPPQIILSSYAHARDQRVTARPIIDMNDSTLS